MIKFTDEQIKSMRDGYPPSEYDFEEAVISLSYEVSELRECMKVAEDALDKVYKCIDNRYGVDASLLAKKIIADTLAAIRIEAAVNQPVTNCNHLGNAAKMREALVKADAAFTRISQSAWFIDANFSETKEVMDAGNAIEEALSAPSRNCDRFSNARDALEAFEKETGETMIEFIRWLFAEAKGATK